MIGKRFSKLLSFLLAARSVVAAGQGWHFVQNGTSGIVALEAIIVSDTLALFFDRATNDTMQIDNHTAWGAVWNLETNTARPLAMKSDSFCASGAMISNGSMVGFIFFINIRQRLIHGQQISVGGMETEMVPQAADGRMGIRVWEPCDDPTGDSCVLFDNPELLHMAETRWYPSSCRIFDGSLVRSRNKGINIV
jgi:hypothetical protein